MLNLVDSDVLFIAIYTVTTLVLTWLMPIMHARLTCSDGIARDSTSTSSMSE
jgi:hypothetical protein